MFDQPFRQVAALWIVFWLLAPSATVAGAPHYTVTADARLEHLDVRACFEATVPRRLTARDAHAPDLLRAATLHTSAGVIALQRQGTLLMLPRTDAPACVQYRVDLNGIGRHWRSDSWRARDVIVIDPALWLWYPGGVGEDERWRIDFELPPGYDVSAPWQRVGRNGDTVTYVVRERMPGWEARTAIGRFSVESIELPGGRLRYALLPGEPAADAAALRRWVGSGARALVSAYGRLPVADVQLLVVPIGHGREPVPWGEVQRGGGNAVHLYIDQRRPASEFMADWVLVHELSHLLHPVIDASDRWLSEGIASYYQNVLRARAGLRSAQWSWDALHGGFERGMRGTPRGRSLAEVSETMMRDHSYMRVYWSGAAIALLADVELRRRTAGVQSLDTALAAFGACCLSADRSWSASELMQQLDRLTETTVFMTLYRKYIDSDEFPELDDLYTALGLQPVSTTRLRLDPTAPEAAICAAIMAAPEDL
ncbi:MAG TPA: hypothetical protein ENJ80_08975 [Gammaproteobacteria bacterium]|nr:hypothetical protein [Gammaproteobacteria bacterium]